MCDTQQTNGTEVIAANPDDFRSEMFRRDTSGAAARAGSSAAADGVDTWLACSAATGACADRCKRARPGPYTPVTDPASRPSSGGGSGFVDSAPDTRNPARVLNLNAAGPSGAAPALTPAVTTSHGCYVNAPASPIDLTGHDEAGSPPWHVVPPPLPPRSDHGPSPRDAALVNGPRPLLGTGAEPQVMACLQFARLQARCFTSDHVVPCHGSLSSDSCRVCLP